MWTLMRKYERRGKRRRRRYIAKKKNKEPYLRANIRSYLLTKKKKLENKRIYFRTKQNKNTEPRY